MTDAVTCEVCGMSKPKDKSLRLTPWDEPVTEDTEWCCAACASKAMQRG